MGSGRYGEKVITNNGVSLPVLGYGKLAVSGNQFASFIPVQYSVAVKQEGTVMAKVSELNDRYTWT